MRGAYRFGKYCHILAFINLSVPLLNLPGTVNENRRLMGQLWDLVIEKNHSSREKRGWPAAESLEPAWAPFLPHLSLHPPASLGRREKRPHICEELAGAVPDHEQAHSQSSGLYKRRALCQELDLRPSYIRASSGVRGWKARPEGSVHLKSWLPLSGTPQITSLCWSSSVRRGWGAVRHHLQQHWAHRGLNKYL